MKRDPQRGRKAATAEATWRKAATLGPLLGRLQSLGHEALEDSSPMFRKEGSKFTDRRNERKLRLLMCACCRRLWEVLPPHAREAVEAIERLVDVGLPDEAREAVEDTAYKAVPQSVWMIEYHPDQAGRWTAATFLQDVIGYTPRCLRAARTSKKEKADEEQAQCDLLRDIFGNPFRPIAFDPAWRTDTAVAIARGVYDSRDFSAMPILADALQDAGCENADILNHCRDETKPHVRGCWVVDLVLGKV